MAERKWPQAIDIFQKILHDEPAAARVWGELGDVATLAGRYAVALDAYQHVIALDRSTTAGYLGAASAVAQSHASSTMPQQHAGQAVEAAGSMRAGSRRRTRCWPPSRWRATMPTRRGARRRWSSSRIRPASGPLYVDARLLYDEGYYAEALPLLERANAELRKVARQARCRTCTT